MIDLGKLLGSQPLNYGRLKLLYRYIHAVHTYMHRARSFYAHIVITSLGSDPGVLCGPNALIADYGDHDTHFDTTTTNYYYYHHSIEDRVGSG